MVTDKITEDTMWKLVVTNVANPWDDDGKTIDVVRYSDEMNELLRWAADQEFNYTTKITVEDYSK